MNNLYKNSVKVVPEDPDTMLDTFKSMAKTILSFGQNPPKSINGVPLTHHDRLKFIQRQLRAKKGLKQAAGIGAAGIGLGVLATYLKHKVESKRQKSNIYGLQELQSDMAPDVAAFGALEKESANYKDPALLSLAVGSATLPLSYKLIKMVQDLESSQHLRKTEMDINRLRRKYDAVFRQQVLEDMEVPESAMHPEPIPKVSSSVIDWALKNPKTVGGAVLGTGVSMAAFQRGLQDAAEKSSIRNQMDKYKDLMATVNRTRNMPVQLTDIAFTPEEMILLEEARKDTGKKVSRKKHLSAADPIKTKEVAADTTDPELKALLSSI